MKKRVFVCRGSSSIREGSIFEFSKFPGGIGACFLVFFKYAIGGNATQMATALKWKPAVRKSIGNWLFWLRDVGSKYLIELREKAQMKLEFPVQWDCGHVFKTKKAGNNQAGQDLRRSNF